MDQDAAGHAQVGHAWARSLFCLMSAFHFFHCFYFYLRQAMELTLTDLERANQRVEMLEKEVRNYFLVHESIMKGCLTLPFPCGCLTITVGT